MAYWKINNQKLLVFNTTQKCLPSPNSRRRKKKRSRRNILEIFITIIWQNCSNDNKESDSTLRMQQNVVLININCSAERETTIHFSIFRFHIYQQIIRSVVKQATRWVRGGRGLYKTFKKHWSRLTLTFVFFI